MNDHHESLHKLSLVLNDLRLEGEFCDAVIKVQDIKFQVHKIVLCRCSPYFIALFKRWLPPDEQIVDIPGLSPDTMKLIIEFAYTGSVSVTEDNVQELLLAADQFNIMHIVQICCNFLGERLCPENCIGIFQLTNFIFHLELRHKAYGYIIAHFEEVVCTDEFPQLSVQELIDILQPDDLNVRSESTVYEAILHWISYKPEERHRYIAELLSMVRLALLNLDYLMINVMSSELVINNDECQLMIKEAHDTVCHIRTNRTRLNRFSCHHLARPRLPNAILLAVGGWRAGEATNDIEAYDIRTDNWMYITDHQEHPRAYHGTAILHGDLYCVGGFDRVDYFNSMRKFNLSSRTWHEVASMYCCRCYVSVTVLNGCIYAMGGYDGHIRLRSAECYRPETNQWSLIAPMHEVRSDASCTTLHNKVYICGGFNGNRCLQTAEYYSPETDQWTMISPMSSRRSGLGVMAYAGHVFAVGGFDSIARLQSAEAYNPWTNTWQNVASMLTPRSNFGIEVLDNLLFVVGGFDGHSTCCNVEYYNATTDEWHQACHMDVSRSAVSCCVVSRLPNMDDYVFPRDLLRLHFGDEDEDKSDGYFNSDNLF